MKSYLWSVCSVAISFFLVVSSVAFLFTCMLYVLMCLSLCFPGSVYVWVSFKTKMGSSSFQVVPWEGHSGMGISLQEEVY